MKALNKQTAPKSVAPERIIQFGEGNFLRAFVDYFFDCANEKADWNGKVVLVQPIAQGLTKLINDQEGLYTLYLRGSEKGEKVDLKRVISSVSRCINPYDDFDAVLELAKSDDLEYIVSNTTEAGIVHESESKFDQCPPISFPAKLTRVLYERYKAGKDGVVVLSCELIDNNGKELQKCVNEYIDDWGLEEEFKTWINEKNTFCSTLVDRIVPGRVRDAEEVKKMEEANGYHDELIDVGEIFGVWIIEGPAGLEDKLPFKKAGLNVHVVEDVTPYKKRKVRILNGAHTSMVLGARLYGLETVGQCLKDEKVSALLKKCIFEEIIPTIGDTEDNRKFGAAVLERFSNPFIKHLLLSIALNSVSKFKARVLPTILEYKEEKGSYPQGLTFSLAALIAFYRTDEANDDEEIMKFMKTASVADILKKSEYWGQDLSDMLPVVQEYYDLIEEKGMGAAYDVVLSR